MGRRSGGSVNAEYRAAAERICSAISALSLAASGDLRVNPHGLVQPVADGAFVECVLFVHASTVGHSGAVPPDGSEGDAA